MTRCIQSRTDSRVPSSTATRRRLFTECECPARPTVRARHDHLWTREEERTLVLLEEDRLGLDRVYNPQGNSQIRT